MTESDKTVMQMALDALERVDCVDGDCDILSLSLCEAVEESIAALRKAIAQPAHESIACAAIECVAQPVEPAEKAKLQWGQFVGCDLPTPAAFGPVAHCQRDQPFFSAQQMNDCVAADRVQRQSAQPTAEQNFCPRCGKRLGGTDDIHTCTPVVDPKETK